MSSFLEYPEDATITLLESKKEYAMAYYDLMSQNAKLSPPGSFQPDHVQFFEENGSVTIIQSLKGAVYFIADCTLSDHPGIEAMLNILRGL